jgi:hypothetical protein
MEKFTALKEMIASAEKDAEAFYKKNNQAAGTRLRAVLQKLKVAAADIRKEVMDKKHVVK